MRQASVWAATAAAVAAVAAVAIVIGTFWTDIGASEMSPAGWLALVLGVVVTMALGIGLMSLVFISSRRGYDDRAQQKDC